MKQAYIQGFLKRASAYGYSPIQADNLLQKTAKLSVRDLEQHMGHLFHDDAVYQDADKGVEEANANSFALRHPYLTGIPTLGIWPSVAKGKAMEHVGTNLLRKHKSLRDERKEHEETEHRRKMELMPLELEQLKRESQERMLHGGSAAAAALLAAHHGHKERMSPRKSTPFDGEDTDY
jgi:hypothetical protein